MKKQHFRMSPKWKRQHKCAMPVVSFIRPATPKPLFIEVFCPAVPEGGVEAWIMKVNLNSWRDIRSYQSISKAYRGEL